ncbi:type II toxin-antitoxin system VapC family toxin [Acidisoma cellulosilytica]|uniref:Ribonuclease VapC n=1 Tax=Acidisoma cellulosilyticum TaxID=2802395 RepID=A0A964E2V5_9PROT|nr:type II toxin-antitoxin system VapC family toxin [Acidisoma cellulosilyticum]MCB8880035.1 type II toxin-antitoxin system VapC family toxin [Acidisoma cellulosilyticum]
MILVDTSVWIDHLRIEDRTLAGLLNSGVVICHPFIIGEIALGSLRNRRRVIDALQGLASLPSVDDATVLSFIEQLGLGGRGIGYVDAHLMTAAAKTAGTTIWTRDRRLRNVAHELSLATPDNLLT